MSHRCSRIAVFGPVVSPIDGYAWARYGMGFSLVGGADSRLQELATEVQRQSTGI